MKMKKVKRKLIVAGLSMVVAASVLTVTVFHDKTDVQATTKVFDEITRRYGAENPVKVLEIVPSNATTDIYVADTGYGMTLNVNKYSELGYFMPAGIEKSFATPNAADSNASPLNISIASRGGALGKVGSVGNAGSWNSATNSMDPADTDYQNLLYNFYQYGMVKSNGTDKGWYDEIGEYPIYGKTAVISTYYIQQYCTQPLKTRVVDGYYVLNTNKTGEYNYDPEKFVLRTDSFNQFWNVKAGSVSKNSLGEIVSVSYNDIADIDTSVLDLPKTKSGVAVVTLATTQKDANGNDVGTGNLDFVETQGVSTPNQLYKGYSKVSSKLYYSDNNQCRIHNSDWWDEYVFGDYKQFADAKVATVYDVKSASEVTVADVDKYDLIYISGKYESFKGVSDLSDEVLLALYNKETGPEHKAIMMDNALYNSACDTNISKLAVLLWQQSQTELYDEWNAKNPVTASEYSSDPNDKYDYLHGKDWFERVTDSTYIPKGETVATTIERHNLKAAALSDDKFWEYLKEDIHLVPADRGNGNFVTGNTYVYNHHLADFKNPKSQIDALDNFANGDFITPYSNNVAASGFGAVLDYINDTNQNSYQSFMSTDITPAVVIQYILVSDGAGLRVMKDTLSVLEIEPVPAYLYNPGRGSVDYDYLSDDIKKNRNDFVSDYLVSYYADKKEFITFTSMTVAEFNARNEDLVETYDIIYIGDETKRDGDFLFYESANAVSTYAWNETEKVYGQKNGNTVAPISTKEVSSFNDSNLNGNIYYHVGDKVSAYKWRKYGRGTWGWLDTEGDISRDDISVGEMFDTRYTGRDITKDKLTKLKEFLNSNALMLVSEDLLGRKDKNAVSPVVNPTITTQDSHGRIDNSSNLYELLEYGLGYKFENGQYVAYSGTSSTNSESVSADDLYYYYEADPSNPVKKNMVAVSDIKQGIVSKENFEEYVSSAKLILNVSEKPAEYGYSVYKSTDTVEKYKLTYNNAENKYERLKVSEAAPQNVIDSQTTLGDDRLLKYEFTVIADSTSSASSEGYYANLYIDVNKDGKFSPKTENIVDATIRNKATGLEADKAANGNYKIEPNVTYTIERKVADTFSGIINWKLDIQSIHLDYVHASEEGYTLVDRPINSSTGKKDTEKKEVKILQITSGEEGGIYSSTLGLEILLYRYRVLDKDHSTDQMTSTRTSKYSTTVTNENLWGKYLDNLIDYNVTIRTVTVGDFEAIYKKKYNDYFSTHTISNEAVQTFNTEFFNNFVIQNVDMSDCDETPINHTVVLANQDGADTAGRNHGVPYGTDEVQGAKLKAMGYKNVTGVNMLVCGFGDAITHFSDEKALAAVQQFVQAGKPVLTTHDFLHYRPTVKQTALLRESFGMDLYGVSSNYREVSGKYYSSNSIMFSNKVAGRNTSGLNYTHSGTGYSRSEAGMNVLESIGKEVAYAPNTLRGKTVPETQGISAMLIEESRNGHGNTTEKAWLDLDTVRGDSTGDGREITLPGGKTQGTAVRDNDLYKIYEIEKINDGQITTYPYHIDDNIEASGTHTQWFALDLTSDQDSDGESDVVVWYSLGSAYDANTGAAGEKSIAVDNDGNKVDGTGRLGNPFSDSKGASLDPANSYYIYNCGNVTYTGAGHLNMADAKDKEVQLFVNTLIGAFDVGLSRPGAYWSETPNGDKVNTILVPYDSNVTKAEVTVANDGSTTVDKTTPDSSVLTKADGSFKYSFVNPNKTGSGEDVKGTLGYFHVNDENIIRGRKEVTVSYYLELPLSSGETYYETEKMEIDGKNNIVSTQNATGAYVANDSYNGKTILVVTGNNPDKSMVTVKYKTIPAKITYKEQDAAGNTVTKTLSQAQIIDTDPTTKEPIIESVQFRVPKGYVKATEKPNSSYKRQDSARTSYKNSYLETNYDVLEAEVVDITNGSDDATGKHYMIDITNLVYTHEVTTANTVNWSKYEPLVETGLTDINGNKTYEIKHLESGKGYAIYLPMNLLSDYPYFNIYLKAKTDIISVATSGDERSETTGTSYIPLQVIKGDLPDLD